HRIGQLVGAFTTEHSEVRAIAAPLLGAGAGGLPNDIALAALQQGFVEHADEASSLIISVLHSEVYERLRKTRRKLAGHLPAPPRVFISHTSKNSEAERWVVDLAR